MPACSFQHRAFATLCRANAELPSSPLQVLSTLSSSGTHSTTPPAPEAPAPALAATRSGDVLCSACGGVLDHNRFDDPPSQHVRISIRVGHCAVSSSGALLHVGDDPWKLGARCVCASAACINGGGGGRVVIPPGARVWFECPSCGLLFGSVADFGRHDCAAQRCGGVGGSSGNSASGRAASRT